MVSPNTSSVQYRPDLRDGVAEEWDVNGEQAGYIAEQLLPMVDVPHAAGTYKRIAREQFTAGEQDDRASGGDYTRIAFGDEDVPFHTEERGLEVPIDHNAEAQASDYYDAEMEATRILLGKLYREHENRVAAKLFNATTFVGRTGNVGTEWSILASATPISDVKDSSEIVRSNCGLKPNTLAISQKVWNNLTECSQVLNRITGGATKDMPAVALRKAVAQMMDVDQILVAGGIKNTANKGQDHVSADIWDDEFALLAYIRPNPSLRTLQLGCTLHWGKDGSQRDFRVEQYATPNGRGRIVQARRQVKEFVQYAECGYLLSNITD